MSKSSLVIWHIQEEAAMLLHTHSLRTTHAGKKYRLTVSYITHRLRPSPGCDTQTEPCHRGYSLTLKAHMQDNKNRESLWRFLLTLFKCTQNSICCGSRQRQSVFIWTGIYCHSLAFTEEALNMLTICWAGLNRAGNGESVPNHNQCTKSSSVSCDSFHLAWTSKVPLTLWWYYHTCSPMKCSCQEKTVKQHSVFCQEK